MGNGIQKYEDKNDARDWNRALKNKIIKYYDAKDRGNLEEKRKVASDILDLFYFENGGYEPDITFSDEMYDFASKIRDVVTGIWKVPNYSGTQEEWNQYVSAALEQGQLLPLIKLIRVGNVRTFLRTPGAEHTEYFEGIKKKVNHMVKHVEENQK